MTGFEYLQSNIEALRKNPTGACIEWPFGKSTNGYGWVWFDNQMHRVHRLAYQIYHGHGLEAPMVLHHCDNKLCFNPAHLYNGTHADNMRDREKRGQYTTRKQCNSKGQRLIVGEKLSCAIRMANTGMSHLKIADAIGVSECTVRSRFQELNITIAPSIRGWWNW